MRMETVPQGELVERTNSRPSPRNLGEPVMNPNGLFSAYYSPFKFPLNGVSSIKGHYQKIKLRCWVHLDIREFIFIWQNEVIWNST